MRRHLAGWWSGHNIRNLRLLVLFFWVGLIVAGSETAIASPAEALTIAVEPTITRVELSQGETWQGTLKIENSNKEAAVYTLRVLPFNIDVAGRIFPAPLPEGSRPATLTNWMHLETEAFALPSGESRMVSLRISVPATAPPGVYRAGVMVGVEEDVVGMSGGALGTGRFVVAGYAATIRGEGREGGRVSFAGSRRFYGRFPASLKVRIGNEGTVTLAPQASLAFEPVFSWPAHGRETIALSLPSLEPGERALSEVRWSPMLPAVAGLYRARVVLTYGQERPERVVATALFAYLSPFLIGLMAAGSIFLLLIFLLFRRYSRRAS